jgi:hypothetical protein
MPRPVEEAATGKRSGGRVGVSPGDAGGEEPEGRCDGERTAVIWESGAGEGRAAGPMDVSGPRESLEGSTVRGADAAAEPGVHPGGDSVAGDWDWRQHRNLQPGGCDSLEVAAGERSGATAGGAINGGRSVRQPHWLSREEPGGCPGRQFLPILHVSTVPEQCAAIFGFRRIRFSPSDGDRGRRRPLCGRGVRKREFLCEFGRDSLGRKDPDSGRRPLQRAASGGDRLSLLGATLGSGSRSSGTGDSRQRAVGDSGWDCAAGVSWAPAGKLSGSLRSDKPRVIV